MQTVNLGGYTVNVTDDEATSLAALPPADQVEAIHLGISEARRALTEAVQQVGESLSDSVDERRTWHAVLRCVEHRLSAVEAQTHRAIEANLKAEA